MTLHPKSTLVLVGTLLIGMLLGALLAGTVITRRQNQLRMFFRPNGFAETIEESIVPTDDAQREAIRDVLGRTEERMQDIRYSLRAPMKAAIDSMNAELDQILTDDQKARLRERTGRFRRQGPPSRDGDRHERRDRSRDHPKR